MPITQDEEDDKEIEEPTNAPKRRSERLQHQATQLAGISQHALHSFVGTTILENATKKLQPDSLFHTNIEEFGNGVVHPETNETIPKYNKLIKEPEMYG